MQYCETCGQPVGEKYQVEVDEDGETIEPVFCSIICKRANDMDSE